jgi:hypothetical protein
MVLGEWLLSIGPAHARANAAAVRVPLHVRLVRYLGQWLCGLSGHDLVRHYEHNRVSLQCASCGHLSPGWKLTAPLAPLNYVRDPFSRHLITRERQRSRSRNNLNQEFARLEDRLASSLAVTGVLADRLRAKDCGTLGSLVHEIVRTSANALTARDSIDRMTAVQIRECLLHAQAGARRIEIKYVPLGFNGCLVSTETGVAIHVNRALARERREWVILHELGHVVLGHRANSVYGLDPGGLAPAQRDSFARQEQEADGYAALCQHVIDGLVAHVSHRGKGTPRSGARAESQRDVPFGQRSPLRRRVC